MTKLLLVEDDDSVREPLAEQLRKASYHVDAVAGLTAARGAIQSNTHDLLLLDWELPDGQGIDLIRELRARGVRTPVIMLTARTEVVDKIVGLEVGADDYVTKPFEIKELVARIRARLRTPVQDPGPVLKADLLEMNLDQRSVKYRGRAVELAKMEFNLLKYFVENPGRVLERDEILDHVWGMENFPNSRTVDTHVLILRQKLSPELIETLRGVGYRFKASA